MYKTQLVIDFGENNISSLVYALDIIHGMVVLYITNEINALLEKNITLREKI